MQCVVHLQLRRLGVGCLPRHAVGVTIIRVFSPLTSRYAMNPCSSLAQLMEYGASNKPLPWKLLPEHYQRYILDKVIKRSPQGTLSSVKIPEGPMDDDTIQAGIDLTAMVAQRLATSQRNCGREAVPCSFTGRQLGLGAQACG